MIDGVFSARLEPATLDLQAEQGHRIASRHEMSQFSNTSLEPALSYEKHKRREDPEIGSFTRLVSCFTVLYIRARASRSGFLFRHVSERRC